MKTIINNECSPRVGRPLQKIKLIPLLASALSSAGRLLNVLTSLIKVARLSPNTRNSMARQVERITADRPEHTALVFENQSFSYGELNARANQYARVFLRAGITKGDCVAVFLNNRPEVLFVILGLSKIGAISGMINTNQKKSVLSHSLSLINAKALVSSGELFSHINEIASELPCKKLFCVDPHVANRHNLKALDINALADQEETINVHCSQYVQLKDPCFYVFTSGTTGLPKASVMSNMRWFKVMHGIGQGAMSMSKDDVFYLCLPFYHNNALTVSLSSVLGAGATLALSKKFSASRFWQEIKTHEATCFSYIGELLRYLLNQPPSLNDRSHNLRMIIGNGLKPDIWSEFEQRFAIPHINEFYGASECNLMFINTWNMEKTAGFCPLAYQIVRYDYEGEAPLLDSFGRMIKAKPGETGLLITEVNDKSPYDGYTNKNDSDAKLLRNVFVEGDCYFNSGDIVFNQGFRHISFVDRTGDTFRWKGENVSCSEVESVLNRFAAIESSAVYGVSIPGADGKAGMAAIQLNADAGQFDVAKLYDDLFGDLPSYAIPLFLRILPKQELTGTFKIIKTQLKVDGFDIERFEDPIYKLSEKDGRYIEFSRDELMGMQTWKG